jgi:hypothetical protein
LQSLNFQVQNIIKSTHLYNSPIFVTYQAWFLDVGWYHFVFVFFLHKIKSNLVVINNLRTKYLVIIKIKKSNQNTTQYIQCVYLMIFCTWKFNDCKASFTIIIYNYGLHEKLISIIIKLKKGYFPRGPKDGGKITLSRFNNYGY